MSAHLDADVAIVGAGPAGSIAAALIAGEGFDVLLVDRHAFPRPKPCGDCLSPEASRVLDRLGVLEHVTAAGPARLEGWRVVGPSGAAFDARFIDICDGDARIASALAIERSRLDAVLLDHAVRAGARFAAPLHVTRLATRENHMTRLECRVPARARAGSGTHHSPADWRSRAETVTIRAPLVIGADGLRSVIAREIGAHTRPPRRRKFSFTAHTAGVRDVTTIGELHVTDGACVGIAPVTSVASTSGSVDRVVEAAGRPPSHALPPSPQGRSPTPMCNVTLVVESGALDRAPAADPVAFFAAMLERFPGLRGRLRDTSLVDHGMAGEPKPLLASGSFDRPARRIAAGGVALAGDAAGYFDPFTGQGIYHALAGAEMLAHAACRALERPSTAQGELLDYARRYTRLVRPVHRVQRLIDEVLRRPALADAAIARLGRRPLAAHALLAVTGDLRRPVSLLSPAVLLSLASPI